jgi:hypothetical protein
MHLRRVIARPQITVLERAEVLPGPPIQTLISAGSLPPFSASLDMTCLCSQTFMAADAHGISPRSNWKRAPAASSNRQRPVQMHRGAWLHAAWDCPMARLITIAAIPASTALAAGDFNMSMIGLDADPCS